MTQFPDVVELVTIVGSLTICTNIIVEALKQVTKDKISTNLLALIVSMGLTFTAAFVYCNYKGYAITWYLVVAFVVVGMFVSYAAMFGFDKFKEAIEQFKTLK